MPPSARTAAATSSSSRAHIGSATRRLRAPRFFWSGLAAGFACSFGGSSRLCLQFWGFFSALPVVLGAPPGFACSFGSSSRVCLQFRAGGRCCAVVFPQVDDLRGFLAFLRTTGKPPHGRGNYRQGRHSRPLYISPISRRTKTLGFASVSCTAFRSTARRFPRIMQETCKILASFLTKIRYLPAVLSLVYPRFEW